MRNSRYTCVLCSLCTRGGAVLAERAFPFLVVAVPLGLNSVYEGISEMPLVEMSCNERD